MTCTLSYLPGAPAGVTAYSIDTLAAATGILGVCTLIFIHTLVEVKMKLEPIGTSAFVRPQTVLTSFLTSPVIITLVVINTEGPRLVQLIPTWTHAPEAAVRVLTRARGGTKTLLLHTLVHVKTPVTVLFVSGRTHAHVAALATAKYFLEINLNIFWHTSVLTHSC